MTTNLTTSTATLSPFSAGNTRTASGVARDAMPATLRFVERDELRDRLVGGEPVLLLEALPERYYLEGHLPGARLMPQDRVDALAASLIPSRDSPVVVYCASATCRNSDQAAIALQRLGYTDVRVYRGGKADWQAAGLPVERG